MTQERDDGVSIVRWNLMECEGYTPYCAGSLHMFRTIFDGEQFVCRACGWRSQFEPEFIEKYKAKWGLS